MSLWRAFLQVKGKDLLKKINKSQNIIVFISNMLFSLSFLTHSSFCDSSDWVCDPLGDPEPQFGNLRAWKTNELLIAPKP